jgi:alkylation response protein AidB-like acyl-CoA dehydrogenase
MVPILREEATAIEDLRRLTPRVLAELVERDMLQILLAPARGEGDLTVTSVLQILETLASADGSTAWDVMAAMGSAFVSSFLPQDTVDRIFATPADTAATAVGRIGVATATEGGYIVEANWPFLSGTPHASWIGGLCAVHDTDEPRVNPDGQPYLVMPMLRKERVQLVDNWFTTGLRGTGSYQAEVRGAFVPASDVIDFARGQRPGLPLLYSLDENAIAPLAAASVAVGIARGAVEAFVQAVHQRTHQSGKPASEAPLPQFALARSEALVEQAAAHLYGTAAMIDRELAAGRIPGEPIITKVSLAATSAVDNVIGAVSGLYRAAGANAVFRASVLDRSLRDVYTLGAHRMVQHENYQLHGAHLFM